MKQLIFIDLHLKFILHIIIKFILIILMKRLIILVYFLNYEKIKEGEFTSYCIIDC
jgi:hypothetical protein